MREIEKRFCTRDKKCVLYKELQQLMQANGRSTLCANENAEAIRELKWQTKCKLGNGPNEYRSETCQTDMLVKAMRG